MDALLMKALEAGSDVGGDKRCGDQKATSAFITIIRPNDTNPKKPFMNLVVFGQQGGPNAVVVLRKKNDKWKARQKKVTDKNVDLMSWGNVILN